jgi:hypothetical protein
MSENIEPISPDDVRKAKEIKVPDYIIETINELIVKNWNSGSSSSLVPFIEIRDLIIIKKIYFNPSSGLICRIMDVFRSKGWHVEYIDTECGYSAGECFKFSIPF